MELAPLFEYIQAMEDQLLSELEDGIGEIIGHDDFNCWVEDGILYLENFNFPQEDFTDELIKFSDELGFTGIVFE